MIKKVLLVDDDQAFSFLCRKLLEKTGIVNEVQTAANGEEALNLLTDYSRDPKAMPEIILLDLNMPVMDGFEFLQAFKKINVVDSEKIKIIIVSSSLDPRDISRAKKMGIRNYLSKPVSEEELRFALGTND